MGPMPAQHPPQTPPLETLRPGEPPPCLGPRGLLCRGCPGWRAMRRALAPGGPWQGAVIHCSATGLTVRTRLEGA